MKIKTPIILTIIVLLYAVYGVAVWAILAHVPSLSVAADVKMTKRLWLYDVVGFLWGAFIGLSIVHMFMGASPRAYGQWNLRNYREPETTGGILLFFVTATISATAVGIFFANMAVRYGLHHR